MARGFGATRGSATTDKVQSAYATMPGAAMSVAIQANRNGAGPTFAYLWGQQNATLSRVLYHYQAGSLLLLEVKFSTTNGAWSIPSLATGSWKQLVVVYDGGSVVGSVKFYVDGVSQTVTLSQTPVGTRTDGGTDNWYVGNRGAGTGNFDGDLAEFGIWSAALDASEANALGQGISPALVRPASLVEYLPLVRDVVSAKLAVPTTTGTAVQSHPRVSYAPPVQVGRSSGGPVAGSAALTASATTAAGGALSLPGAGALTATATVAAAGALALPGASALAASATLTSGGQVAVAGASALTATATVASTGQVAVAGQAALSGSAVVGSAAVVAVAGLASLAATATLVAAGSVQTGGAVAGAASLTTAATVGATGALALPGAAGLTASATVAATATVALAGAAALVATGVVGADAVLAIRAVAGLTATATVAASGTAAGATTRGRVAIGDAARYGLALADARRGGTTLGETRRGDVRLGEG